MDLYKEILIKALEREEITVCFPNLELSAEQIVESVSYNALQKIKTIISDDSLSDAECFMKIENIVCVFEEIGSTSSGRHDF